MVLRAWRYDQYISLTEMVVLQCPKTLIPRYGTSVQKVQKVAIVIVLFSQSVVPFHPALQFLEASLNWVIVG